jgi:diguanylate cyclase (GGDEF)-like protein
MTESERRTIFLGAIGVALVGAADAAVGFEINLLALHMVPVLLVTWYTSLRWGVFFALLMSLTSVLAAYYLAEPARTPLYRYLDLGSDFLATLVLVVILSRLRGAYRAVQQQSRTDALTGCLNRNGFNEQLDAEIARQRRYGHPFSLVYFDVDNFKALNDTHGHHAGDRLLSDIGHALNARLRTVDSAGRIGGDEFALLLREATAAAAIETVTQLKQALDQLARRSQPQVGFSIGVASFSRAPRDADSALQLADVLMYEAKQAGKNAVRSKEY